MGAILCALLLAMTGCGDPEEAAPGTTIAESVGTDTSGSMTVRIQAPLATGPATCSRGIDSYSIIPIRYLNGAPYPCASGCVCTSVLEPELRLVQFCLTGGILVTAERYEIKAPTCDCVYGPLTIERQR